MKTLRERFDAKYVIDDESGCWIWTGYCQPEGYGRFCFEGRSVQAHRVAYQFFVGLIPDGLQVDHLCRNRRCVNPAHLEAVTSAENKLRGESPPALNARKTYCDQGHEFTTENTETSANGWRRCRTCRRAWTRAYRDQRRAA